MCLRVRNGTILATDQTDKIRILNPCNPCYPLAQFSMKTIALGSDRAAKIMAVRATVARIAAIDPDWANANVVARRVETSVPSMPLTDWQLMQGARERALAAHDSLRSRRLEADIYVGLEGGFHSDFHRRRVAYVSERLGLRH